MTYKLGLYEKALPPSLSWEEKFSAARQAGFDWLEISIDETGEKLARLEWKSEEIAALRRAAEKCGCPVMTMCLSGHRRFPLGSRDPGRRGEALEITRRAVRFGAGAGVRVIQLAGYDVYYEESGEDTRGWFEENLLKCVEIAAENGVTLGFETMETAFMDTVGKAMSYVRTCNSPYLGLYPDVGNLANASLLYGEELAADLRKGEGHILAAHLKETRPGVYRNLAFGQGHTDYLSAVRTLYGMGVRMYTGEFWHQGGENWRRGLSEVAGFLRERIERAAALTGGTL